MKIYSDISLENFDYWSGAVDTAKRISEADKWDDLEAILEDIYPDGMTDTQLNDLMWMDSETVYEWLGISEEEEEDEEEEEEYKEPEDCEDFDEFCEQFSGCSGCPYKDIMGKCEDLFNNDKDSAIPLF